MKRFNNALKDNKLKNTPRRQAIIDIFNNADRHLTAEEVWYKLKRKFTRCGLPSVYRNLETLVDCGILTRIQKFDRKKHYGLCVTGTQQHHHHIICIKCGKIAEIAECSFDSTKKIQGYRVVSHFMQVNGICHSCDKQNK